MRALKTTLFTLGVAAGAGSPASAQDITGALTFYYTTGTNYFDPQNGYVPSGYGNSSGSTVPIGSGVEFGYKDGSNLDTADFTDTSLTISDRTSSEAGPFYMTFESSVANLFDNAAFSSNGFGGTFSVSGDTLTFSAPSQNSPTTRTSVITFSGVPGSVPESSTWAMMLTGFGIAGLSIRHRRLQMVDSSRVVAA